MERAPNLPDTNQEARFSSLSGLAFLASFPFKSCRHTDGYPESRLVLVFERTSSLRLYFFICTPFKYFSPLPFRVVETRLIYQEQTSTSPFLLRSRFSRRRLSLRANSSGLCPSTASAHLENCTKFSSEHCPSIASVVHTVAGQVFALWSNEE